MSNLKRIREQAGISQRKLSTITGISNRVIPSYESKARDINKAQAVTVYKLAKALGCTMEELLELEEIN